MKKYIFGVLALGAVILGTMSFLNPSSTMAQEYRGFYGTITYKNCECTDEAYADRVYIKKLPSGPTEWVPIWCNSGSGSYDTEASNQLVFAPGDYQIWVEFDPEYSECETSNIEQIEHGYSKQQVNLTALGPTGGETK